MNSDIVPTGPTETITGGTITRKVLVLQAETDVVVSNVVWQFPITPPTAGAVNTFTIPKGANRFNLKAFTFTGTATLIYRDSK